MGEHFKIDCDSLLRDQQHADRLTLLDKGESLISLGYQIKLIANSLSDEVQKAAILADVTKISLIGLDIVTSVEETIKGMIEEVESW